MGFAAVAHEIMIGSCLQWLQTSSGGDGLLLQHWITITL